MNDPQRRSNQTQPHTGAPAFGQPGAPQRDRGRLPLGRLLIERGLITPWQLFYALRCHAAWNATLSEILRARGWVAPSKILDIQAETGLHRRIDLAVTPPDLRLSDLLPPEFCIAHNVVPWACVNGRLILATGRPDRLDELRDRLPPRLQSQQIAVANEADITTHVVLHGRRALTKLAESRVQSRFSCRSWRNKDPRNVLLLATFSGLIALALALHPILTIGIFMVWALLSVTSAMLLRTTALILHLIHSRDPAPPPLPQGATLPRISVLVPLFRETEIAQALIHRLTRLTYPRALLDVVLVLEEQDQLTQDTIAQTHLPKWMRVIEVPTGSGVTTKPRALNYGLDFCTGDIIGIWDAEDAPASDQLEQVARHFAAAAPDVACLQGVLDYYNPYTNWISRCFTIEYATWFRIVLPGLARLGLAIPLGGTTLFLRREIILKVGGWDAHNVTEDADLGYRLSRHGYRTELLRSVTQEEANYRPISWVRQRSRWLKGFMVTYLVHMRHPIRLWRDLGTRKFLGFHVVFLTTLTQFLLAPLLWILWAAAFGWILPLDDFIDIYWQKWIAFGLALAAVSNGATWIAAVITLNRPRLYPWIMTMVLYFPLATLAAYKALIELLVVPFYWDKTAHGKTTEGTNPDVQTQEEHSRPLTPTQANDAHMLNRRFPVSDG